MLRRSFTTQKRPDATCYYPAGLSVADWLWVGIGYLPHRCYPLRATSCGPVLGPRRLKQQNPINTEQIKHTNQTRKTNHKQTGWLIEESHSLLFHSRTRVYFHLASKVVSPYSSPALGSECCPRHPTGLAAETARYSSRIRRPLSGSNK